jgi:Helicase conserved C-terminal domain
MYRTFADYLRTLDDAALERLFSLRPDLISPTPPDYAALAVRANSGPSIARVIDSLNAFELQVLEALMILEEPIKVKDLEKITDASARFVYKKFEELCLVYDGVIPTQVREAIGAEPAGLGPRSLAKLDLKKLSTAPESAVKVMQALCWGPPRGSVGDIKNPGPGIAWLLEHHFVVPLDQRHVVMPAEVAIHLRGGKVHKELASDAPKLDGKKFNQTEIDRSAIANISNVLRWCEELLNFWGETAPSALRAGGVGVRDLKDVAIHLGVTEGCAAFVAELCYLSGLVAIDADETIAPTNSFDIWLTQDFETKWRNLVSLWLITSRVSGLVGRSDQKFSALGPELDRVSAANIRMRVLEELRGNIELSPSLASFIDRMKWLAPLRRGSNLRDDLVKWTLEECEWLGITGLGALSTFGAELLEGDEDLGVNAALPTPIDFITIQSDQTAIAPGPLQHELAVEMSQIADIESRGAATVYRFTESSIRRGLDHGKSSTEIIKFLTKISKSNLPQPLEYLITDTARKHGQLRVGAIHCYLRCEDPSVLTEILSDKRIDVALRQIAPTVLVSDFDIDEVLNVLRNNGYLPAAESAQGILLSSPHNKRVKNRPKPPRIVGEIELPTAEAIAGAIRAIKVGEQSTAKQNQLRNSGTVPRTTANETLEILNKNLNRTLSIGYADNNGGVSHRIIDPQQIANGVLLAKDHSTGELQTFKIIRITGVAPL